MFLTFATYEKKAVFISNTKKVRSVILIEYIGFAFVIKLFMTLRLSYLRLGGRSQQSRKLLAELLKSIILLGVTVWSESFDHRMSSA